MQLEGHELRENEVPQQPYNYGGYQLGAIENERHTRAGRFLNGRSLKFCRACNDNVTPKERVQGIIRGRNDGPITIYVDYVIGQCGHTVEDDSH
jgi:hypothetical protein